MQSERYIFDVLYGKIQFPDYVWKILPSPELQRLREVRLCNINSLCLTGGANINRYEHALGTAYLALLCLKKWPTLIPLEVQRRIVLAALLHDISSGAFGHSVQYVIHSSGFEHEAVDHLFDAVDASPAFTYQHLSLEPVFFGMPKHLHTLLGNERAEFIVNLIAGRGYYGQLISAEMDLDNIDNVFRLAYHIGVTRDTTTPLHLAQSIWVSSNGLTVSRDAIKLVQRWQMVRRRLYDFLLLNPDEFSAKCMLERALTRGASEADFLWHDVDFELLQKIAGASSEGKDLASRLMIGNLYGCLGIYVTTNIDCHDQLADGVVRGELEKRLSQALRNVKIAALTNAVVRLHTIRDVGKTERGVTVATDDGAAITIGAESRRVLIGVFVENRHLSMDKLPPQLVEAPPVQDAVRRTLSAALGPLKALKLYAEGEAKLS